MTREEYEKLLQSDYWRGYSYSLIKERNFTCEDCGRSFPNERNKLQVHHLVYRDVNPWSYRPEEIVVLCEECHRKRHGLYIAHVERDKTHVFESTSTASMNSYRHDGFSSRGNDDMRRPMAYSKWELEDNRERNKKILSVAALIFAFLLAVVFWPKTEPTMVNDTDQQKELQTEDEAYETVDMQELYDIEDNRMATNESEDIESMSQIQEDYATNALYGSEMPGADTQANATTSNSSSSRQKTTMELLEEKTHKSVVEQAKREGVSTEGSTSDILGRITHKSVVEQARREGVSTEGSTSEILGCITHKSVVEQARRKGVSTEGSTSEILDRITHKSVVEQAKREGVSTEGSTSDILDRLTRKYLEGM